MTSIWYVDAQGALHTARVRTGRTDGQKTQIEGKGIEEGTQVITSVTDGTTAGAAAATSGQASNPFQPARPGGGGRRPGGL